MEDKLQEMADAICHAYGFHPVRIPFMTMSKKFVIYYTLLFKPEHSFFHKSAIDREVQQFEKQGERALAEARRGRLARDFVDNPGRSEGVSEFERLDLEILEYALELAEGKRSVEQIEKTLSHDVAAKVLEVAGRIKHFSIGRQAWAEFKELKMLWRKFEGKLPLVEGDKFFEKYVHECIHFILERNNLATRNQAFDEGLTSYLHKRFRGRWRIYWSYWEDPYREFVKWFSARLDTVPERQMAYHLHQHFGELKDAVQKEFGMIYQ